MTGQGLPEPEGEREPSQGGMRPDSCLSRATITQCQWLAPFPLLRGLLGVELGKVPFSYKWLFFNPHEIP